MSEDLNNLLAGVGVAIFRGIKRKQPYILLNYKSGRAILSQPSPYGKVRMILGAVTITLFIGFSALLVAYMQQENQYVAGDPEPATKTSSGNRKSPYGIYSSPLTPPIRSQALYSPSGLSSAATTRPFLFGMGAQMEGTMKERLYNDAPLSLLTSWYNGPSDLQFMSGWHNTIIPEAYASGHSLHLVVWAGDEEKSLQTKYGAACGREYPLTTGFLDDMRQLSTIFNGSGTLYVSLFTEFQTYPCEDNTWSTGENYYLALKDQYRSARDIFKANAPNSQISLTWGGWQSRWDDKGRSGGKSLFPKFKDVMEISDFQSFQAMDSTNNVQDVSDMTRILHGYGSTSNNKVMVAHYKPDNSSQTTWENDLKGIFTASNIQKLRQDGLFVFSFMDEKNINASEASYQQARTIIQNYAR